MKYAIDDTDKVYFPMKQSEMDDYLDAENTVMCHRYDCFDLDQLEDWNKTGVLFVWGHGSQDVGSRHLIRGKLGQGGRSAKDVAADIASTGFPKGADPEIIVWSCYSGVVGGFAQLLCLYLIKHGYTGKRVWGSKKLTGTNDGHYLTVFDAGASAKRRAQLADVTYYIGR